VGLWSNHLPAGVGNVEVASTSGEVAQQGVQARPGSVASSITGWKNGYATSIVLSKPTLTEGLKALDLWVRDPARKMFTVTELPCAAHPDGVAQAPPETKRAMFFGLENTGAARMRGEMMAAALNALPDWTASCCGSSAKSWSWARAKGNFTQRLDLCVFIKYGKGAFQQHCRERGAVMLYDLLDNIKAFRDAIIYNNFGQFPDWPDVMIMPTNTTAGIMNEVYAKNKTKVPKHKWPPHKTEQFAKVLYHHQANPGVINPPTSMMKQGICRVAILAGSSVTNLNPDTFDKLYQIICSSKSVRYFSRVKQHQDHHSKKWLLHAYDFACPDHELPPDPDCIPFEEMNRTSGLELREAGPKHGVLNKGRATTGTQNVDLAEAALQSGLGGQCFGDQWKHHIDPVLNLVDIALQWPPNLGVPSDWDASRIVGLNRPTTRFLFWVSRGVPVLFGHFFGYTELAESYDYRLPSGRIPSTKSFRDLPGMLRELSDPKVRAFLRERGYHIAMDHTLAKETDRLVEMYEEVMKRRQSCPACSAEFKRLDQIRAKFAGTGRTPRPQDFRGYKGPVGPGSNLTSNSTP